MSATLPVIVAARRSPIGKFGGNLAKLSAAQMGSEVLSTMLDDFNKWVGGSDIRGSIKEVIVGQVLTAGNGQNPARQTALGAKIPVEVPSYTINKVCGSGLKSIHLAMQQIQTGEADCVVAGGQESMTQSGHILGGSESRSILEKKHPKTGKWNPQMMGPLKIKGALMKEEGSKLVKDPEADWVLMDTMLKDGLTCAFNKYHMGITAENVAAKYGLTRQMQDEFAMKSQEKARVANDAGKFKEQMVKMSTGLETDEYINYKTDAAGLAKLGPAFQNKANPAVTKENGTVTAGNASGINDGAAFVLVMSEKKALEMKAPIIAVCRGFASAGLDPTIMGMGPFPATSKLLPKVGWKMSDIDVIESNEAFASQSLGVAKELNFDMSKVNVNGGAIALGHPIGASGTRILVDLLYELKRSGKSKGLATMCIGGGQGVALAVENAAGPASKL